MSTRRPLYRVRYDPIIDMWVVSGTEHAPPGFRNSTAWTSWPEAMRVAHRVAELLRAVLRELEKANRRRHTRRPKLAGYAQGGIVPPITNTGIPARTARGRIEQDLRDTNHQIGWLADQDELWDQGDPGRSYDLNAGGIANLTYEVKPGLVRLEPAPPWANNDQNRKN